MINIYNEKSRPRDGFFSIGISLLYLRYKKDCVVSSFLLTVQRYSFFLD